MSPTVQSLLESFERLPDADKQYMLREILRRGADMDWPALSDDDLVQCAEKLFLELDKAEASDE